jgi:hypothetical protein
MGRHREMYDPPTLMRQHQKHVQDLAPDRRHGEEVHSHHTFYVFSRNVFQVWDGGLLRRTIHLLTLVSPIWMPSWSRSP